MLIILSTLKVFKINFVLIPESDVLFIALKYLMEYLYSVFSEDEPDLNSDLEISVSVYSKNYDLW